MHPTPPRYTCFNLPAHLVPVLRTLAEGDTIANTLRSLVTLAALHPLAHARSYAPVHGPRVKYQFADKPGARVLPLLRAQGLSLSAVMVDLLLDPATPARVRFWRALTPTEQREDFRRAAARFGLASPALVSVSA